MRFCDSYLMSIIYLAQVHNISFEILSTYIPSEYARGMHDWRASFQGLWGYMKIPNRDTTMLHPDCFSYSMTFNERLFYCTHVQLQRDFDPILWICAFSMDSWMLLIGTVSILIIFLTKLNQSVSACSSMRVLREAFNVVIILVRQFPAKVDRWQGLYIGIAFWAMLISSLYENSIVSTVTINDPPDAYDSIKELADNDHRIFWYMTDERQGKPEVLLGPQLNGKGVIVDVNKTF